MTGMDRGMGDLLEPTSAVPAVFAYPPYCSIPILGSFLSECKIPTISQIITDTSGYGGALTPASIAAGEAMAAANIGAFNRMNPGDYSNYQSSVNYLENPILNPTGGSIPWGLLILGGVALLLMNRL